MLLIDQDNTNIKIDICSETLEDLEDVSNSDFESYDDIITKLVEFYKTYHRIY